MEQFKLIALAFNISVICIDSDVKTERKNNKNYLNAATLTTDNRWYNYECISNFILNKNIYETS